MEGRAPPFPLGPITNGYSHRGKILEGVGALAFSSVGILIYNIKYQFAKAPFLFVSVLCMNLQVKKMQSVSCG